MSKHPVIHLLHDAGLAAWSGGSLMGAIGLNGAAASLEDPRARSRAATAGWSRWAPYNAAAVAAHVAGGLGLTVTDWSRVRSQQGVARSTAIKAAVTGAGLGVAAWSAALNRKMAAAGPVPVKGATEAGPATPPDVAQTLRQLKLVQWLNPLVTFGLIAATAVHEEQMRTSQQAKGRLQRRIGSLSSPRGAAIAAAAGVGLLAARQRRAARPADGIAVVEVVEVADLSVVDLSDGAATDPTSSTTSSRPGAFE